MKKLYFIATMLLMIIIGCSHTETVKAAEPYKENEYFIFFRPEDHGNEYFDRKSIIVQKLTPVNAMGTVSENLTLYMPNKRSFAYLKSGVEITVAAESAEWTMLTVDKRRCFARTEEFEKVFERTRFVYNIKEMNSMMMCINKDAVVREEPNLEAKEIGTLEAGEGVNVTGGVTINRAAVEWFRIDYNGGDGYVQKQYVSNKKPKPTSTPTPTPTPTSTPTPVPTSAPTATPLPELSAKEKEAAAMEVAMEIANHVLSTYSCESDWVKVNAASRIVAQFCSECTYTTKGKDYREAYGVFIKGEFSCAGATRALGMVLECMGYEWEHANPNQYTHQWCIIEMDGQKAWADGQGGFAAYGVHPMSLGVPVIIQMDGTPRAMDANGNYIPNVPMEVPEFEYNPAKIQQQVEEAIQAAGKNIKVVWTTEDSLRTEGINYLKSEYSSEELVMRDLNQLMKKAGLYTMMEYLAISVEKENAEINN